MNKIHVSVADWRKDIDEIRRIREAVFIAEQSVPPELEWDADDADAVHFLAFDLWVGHWMAADVLARGRARWPLLVLLPATFMYGPLGLLLYLATRLAGPRPSPAGLGS